MSDPDDIGSRWPTLTLPLRGFPLPEGPRGRGGFPSPSGGRWPEGPDEGLSRDSISSPYALRPPSALAEGADGQGHDNQRADRRILEVRICLEHVNELFRLTGTPVRRAACPSDRPSMRAPCSCVLVCQSACSPNLLAALVFLQLRPQLFAHNRSQRVGLTEEIPQPPESCARQFSGTIAVATTCTNVSFSDPPF